MQSRKTQKENSTKPGIQYTNKMRNLTKRQKSLKKKKKCQIEILELNNANDTEISKERIDSKWIKEKKDSVIQKTGIFTLSSQGRTKKKYQKK